ncbi:exporters of the RND superfamily [Labilithrix luteola]|uniref:Exporters of the RND superfamily n=1 Tax=Labilithrix luteola TaxID=1391654 RepID=A0A0K1Q7X6_9BACT|nr:MMPL family transporter [Labilithrix luteola]AKV01829.1 exporters of the RND superfamily [Labilithrix luteola]
MSELPEADAGKSSRVRRIVENVVDFAIRRPWFVIFVAIGLLIAAKQYTTRLELKSDFLELLPRDSPGFIAFEQELKRVGGGASLIVINESPDRKSNERFIDELSKRIEGEVETRNACLREACGGDVPQSGLRGGKMPACAEKCGPELISYVESGTKEVRSFFENNKWLYADLADLEDADRTLDHQVAIRSGLVSDLESDDDEGSAKSAKGDAGAGAGAGEKKAALGMDEFRDRWEAKANKSDDFPTGYFAAPDGKMMGIRIVSPTTGTGDKGGDMLLARVQEIVASMNPSSYEPTMKVGYAGDIPNAIAEKDSIVSEAAFATGMATLLILVGIFTFFRSFSALVVMLLPTAVGIACAYSFATATFGYVNTSGAFLGAIILGNGINYPIVLLGRYREFVARGMDRDVAKKAAVWNAFRAELVGASVAGIAYGSLVITRFRGFSQFGMIGFVGMLLVWLSIIPLVPAIVTAFERIRAMPGVIGLVRARDELFDMRPFSWVFTKVDETGTSGPIIRTVARVTERWPWLFIGLAGIATTFAVVKLPTYLRDPWEYNFDHLGSRGSKKGGAGEWSVKAEKVFGGKMNIAGAMMLADSPEQVPAVKAQILANDALDPEGKLVKEIATIADLLPGADEEQTKKLAVLERIRDRLTPRVLHDMNEDEQKRLLELKPPETLRLIGPKDIPSLLRRRFEEKNGVVGTVFYVKFVDLSFSDGHNLLRIAKTTDNVKLADGTVVKTASRSTIFAEMIRSMERDGPLASFASLAAVAVVVILATASFRGAATVLVSLILGVLWMVGGAAWSDMKLNFLNFIALPITFGIGCEYPFNIFDRSRLLGGEVTMAVRRSGGAVALCSYTTIVGYGSLVFADNQALQSFGHLAMSGEITCLIAAMLVLPSLLHVWKPRR